MPATLMTTPFFSIVTISFNQRTYLEETLKSILDQTFTDFEYIVQDPGSTDGSREVISSYSSRLIAQFEPDNGPADGLNRAFSLASGRYYLFLNSDDVLLPRSLEKFHLWITNDSCQHDVYSGACKIIDSEGAHLRYAFSDQMNLAMSAYGQCIIIQPSSVISAKAFREVGGFNTSNRSAWDGELFIDLALKGYRFSCSADVFSCYRVHQLSITGSGSLENEQKLYHNYRYKMITGRSVCEASPIIAKYYWLKRRILNPRDTWERILHGPIFKRAI